MELDDDDDHATRVNALVVSIKGPVVRIMITTPSDDEAAELAQVLVRHFKEYGAATIELVQKGGTLQ